MTVKELIEKLQTQPESAQIQKIHLSPIIDTNPDSWMYPDTVWFEKEPNGIKIVFASS